MTSVEAALQRIHRDLTQAGAAFALIGGLAVSVRTEPRFTRDADFAVAVENDAQAEQLILRLRREGYGVAAVLEQKRVGRLATVRLTIPDAPDEGPVIDLLFSSSGIEPEIVAEAERLEVFRGMMLPVARTGHLIALKLLSRNDLDRPQDLIDLRGLVRAASSSEIARARAAVRLIQRRGYDRARNLPSSLEELLTN